MWHYLDKYRTKLDLETCGIPLPTDGEEGDWIAFSDSTYLVFSKSERNASALVKGLAFAALYGGVPKGVIGTVTGRLPSKVTNRANLPKEHLQLPEEYSTVDYATMEARILAAKAEAEGTGVPVVFATQKPRTIIASRRAASLRNMQQQAEATALRQNLDVLLMEVLADIQARNPEGVVSVARVHDSLDIQFLGYSDPARVEAMRDEVQSFLRGVCDAGQA